MRKEDNEIRHVFAVWKPSQRWKGMKLATGVRKLCEECWKRSFT